MVGVGIENELLVQVSSIGWTPPVYAPDGSFHAEWPEVRPDDIICASVVKW